MLAFVLNANPLKRKSDLAANEQRNLLIAGIILVAVGAIDQATKLWALATLSDGRSIQVLGDFFMFTLVYNKGGAMGTSLGPSSYYLVTSILILCFVLVYIVMSRRNRSVVLPLAFIAAGAIGNIIDRIRFGMVIDFIDIDFFDIDLFGIILTRWWTFNIADAAISCSIVYLLIHTLIPSKQKTTLAEGTSATIPPVSKMPVPDDPLDAAN